ncbi:MAG: tartrate dehydrogenase [Verrucomicrobiae bacterium]|nr:tartrate dehydrogenase [Verrucomicrobiae bacterium]
MKTHKIALYPGDGIGQEVVAEAVRVLDAIQQRSKTFHLETENIPWGCDYEAKTGQIAPPNFLEKLRPFDAIFLGALGDPRKRPDHMTLEPLICIRQSFDQYACVRPAKLFPGISARVTANTPIDMVIVRENSEGEYFSCGGRFKIGDPDEVAVQTALHTRKGVTRILRFGFELARSRRRHLTMITKSNALKHGMVMWDQILETLRSEYPDVEADQMHVDAASMDFVRRPQRFDVVVASNLFGDILSDLAGAIVGGLGLLPSANLNPERHFPSMFEPVHGSAPDIAGKGIANPVATILSSAMMLDWLGEKEAATAIRQAVESTLGAGHATVDLGGRLKTHEMTDRILEQLPA